MTLLVTDATAAGTPAGKNALRITAYALNGKPNTSLVSASGRRLFESWADSSPILTGRVVTFMVEGDDTVGLEVVEPLSPEGAKSNRITVKDGKVGVERPAPDLVLATRSQFKTVTLMVLGTKPEHVHLRDGRGHPISDANFECAPGSSPWFEDVVSECRVWFYDPKDGVGFNGQKIQAIVDTPTGPMKTRVLEVR